MACGRGKDQATRAGLPWYGAGLRFACQPDCGACCTNHDDYAYVYLSDADLRCLAEHLGLRPRVFAERYTTREDGDVVLRMDGASCPFLDGAACSVYPARPSQCRTFPFWEENLTSRRAWRRLKTFCPGVGRGEVQSLRVIRRHLAEREPPGSDS